MDFKKIVFRLKLKPKNNWASMVALNQNTTIKILNRASH